MKIAICEDNKFFLEDLVLKCEKYLEERKLEGEVITFLSAEEIIMENLDANVLILDIKLSGISGIELKNMLEEKKDETPIIFMTNYDEYMSVAFGVNVYNYLTKPIEEEKIFRELDKIRKKHLYNPLLETGLESNPFVAIRDILYVKYEKDYPLIITNKEKILAKGSLSFFEEKLSDYGFFRVNKSCIVNLDKLRRKEDILVFPDDSVVSLSRRRKTEFNRKYTEYIFQKLQEI